MGSSMLKTRWKVWITFCRIQAGDFWEEAVRSQKSPCVVYDRYNLLIMVDRWGEMCYNNFH